MENGLKGDQIFFISQTEYSKGVFWNDHILKGKVMV